MERQMTATTELTFDPSLSLRFLVLVAATVGAAVLLVAMLLTTGSGTDAGAELASANGARWQAMAESFEVEAAYEASARAASASRLAGLAAAHSGLSAADSAVSDRWAGVAATYTGSGLIRGQLAAAARLNAGAGN